MASTARDKSKADDGSKKLLDGYIYQLAQHHKKTGCTGEVKSYNRDGMQEYSIPLLANVRFYMRQPNTSLGWSADQIRAFCVSCKEEWLLSDLNKNIAPDGDLKPVAHHYVPTFCCLQVSDTGHYVRWRDIHKLKRGDHVAWLRPPSYWHHAIVTEDVQEGASEFHVIEWSPKKICENTKKKFDLLENWCYSPMYKVVYPKEIVDQNPPDLIMLRAETMMSLGSEYSLLVDNCEHFATFCKTGSHKCNQLFQYSVRMRAWIARFLVAFLHVAFVVSFSETIEWFVPNIDEDWLGAITLFAFEGLSLLMIIFITYKIDTPKESFMRRDQTHCTSACVRAVAKSIMQSVTLMGFAFLFGIGFVHILDPHKKWSVKKRVGTEMGFGCLGGIVGNMVGFILFYFIPCPCWYTVIEEKGTGKATTQEEEGTSTAGLPQSQSKSAGRAITSNNSEISGGNAGTVSYSKSHTLHDDEVHVATTSASQKIKLNSDDDTTDVRQVTPKSNRKGEEGESETDSTQVKIESLSSSTEDDKLETEA